MASMMAPSLALDESGGRARSRSGGRHALRSSLLQVVAGVLDEGLDLQAEVDSAEPPPGRIAGPPRGGLGPETIGAVGQPASRCAWPDRHHYFGGVSGVTRNGCRW